MSKSKENLIAIIIILIISIIYIILLLNKGQNIFVLTVDDIKLSTSHDLNNTELVVNLLQKHNMPATFFAIPSELKEYSFPKNIELAQHGYDHYNEKLDSYYEFKGLNVNESKRLIIEGKIAMEYYGYDVKGFRAPCFYLDKDLIPFIEENYEYDSSFYLPKGYSIPILLDDPTRFVCSDKGCNKIWLSIRKNFLFLLMDINDLFNQPIILTTHSQGIARLLKNDNGKAYLNDIFNEINRRNYKKMTMIEYARGDK